MSENQYKLRPTRAPQRRKAIDDFIVCVSPGVKRSLALGRFALVSHESTYCDPARTYRIHCRVVEDAGLDGATVRLDHSVRTALDIPFQEYKSEKDPIFNDVTVTIAPLRVSWRVLVGNWFARLLGARYVFMRVMKADIADIERNVVRIPREAFDALAIAPTGRIVVEGVKLDDESREWKLVRRSMSAFRLTDDIIQRRAREAVNAPERYPNPTTELSAGSDDIWSIYVDQYAREKLGVGSLDPVKVRQNSHNLFLRESRESSVLFVATALVALAAVLALSPIRELSWIGLGVLVVCSLVITTAITIVNMRAKAGR
jgi:hypothetical protein